ncbi:MAG: hypothetical protein A3A33_03180 [Candidatus Yanofskybacteria bacterium RIFCSPLOWO2_01_FULL_49_25]|uniref:Uncharacterized protein n=1 Tax=Candidatus Yanofskybacteria bacterium RIFCSPLOWO2_01_FULL_49_25 TaxID=1802701 RepID=A0A1F8GWC2_9BACT|nr:MAG: hypothetical protein A3A33_03180 [Candidatus Yanofskybacteria bacterium RIFCSPLOWO2_01_FULL_49_25]
MNYPLHLRFKVLTLGKRIFISDQAGTMIMYAKQKMFKLKEEVHVFGDEAQTQHKYNINADRIIDFSPKYSFTDVNHLPLGSVRRQGMKSLWRAHYDITTTEATAMTISQENPWTNVFDSIFSQLPIIGMFAGYLFHPTYIVKTSDGRDVMRLRKQPAFLEGYFTIEKLDASLTEQDETSVLLSLFTVVLMERTRG